MSSYIQNINHLILFITIFYFDTMLMSKFNMVNQFKIIYVNFKINIIIIKFHNL